MKNSIRCCISCILPCGALDVIRIVHANGRVEEISGTIKAEEIMKLHPKHLLKKPTTSSSICGEDGMISPNIVVVPPDALLQRGKIYFLIPLPNTIHSEKKNRKKMNPKVTTSRSSSSRRQKKEVVAEAAVAAADAEVADDNNVSVSSRVVSDQYPSEILSNKASTQRDRRRGRVGIWRPHLESICETPVEALL